MKEEKGSLKIGTAALLCVGVIFLTGCVSKDDVSTSGEIAGEEQEEQLHGDDKNASLEAAEAPALEEEGVLGSTDAENEEDSDEENAEKAQALYKAQIRHYYSGVLTQIMATGLLPHEKTEGRDPNEKNEVIGDNAFAVADVDQDGREELLIRWTSSSVNGMSEEEYEYDYNPASGQLRFVAGSFPTVTYYDNGIHKVERADEQWTAGPYTLYRYQLGCYQGVDGWIEGWQRGVFL